MGNEALAEVTEALHEYIDCSSADVSAAATNVAKLLSELMPEKGYTAEQVIGDALMDEDCFLHLGRRIEIENGARSCRVCGCTYRFACPGGCSFVEEDLCSQCALG